MRRVLRNADEVFHYWANQTQSEGKAGNVYFEGSKIYSYGSHFCMARILPSGVVAYTTRSYSRSTTSHLSGVRHAANHRRFVYCHNPNDSARSNMEYARRDIARLLEEAQAPRIRQTTRDGKRAHALHAGEEANAYLAALPEHERLSQIPIDLNHLDDIAAELQRIRDAEKAEAERQAALRAEAAKVYVDRWRENTEFIATHMLYDTPVALRLNRESDTIETSRGAEIPVSHAKRLWPTIKAIKDRGDPLELSARHIPVGVYHLNEIRFDGSIRVGCHDIAYAEIEGMARELGLLESETV